MKIICLTITEGHLSNYMLWKRDNNKIIFQTKNDVIARPDTICWNWEGLTTWKKTTVKCLLWSTALKQVSLEYGATRLAKEWYIPILISQTGQRSPIMQCHCGCCKMEQHSFLLICHLVGTQLLCNSKLELHQTVILIWIFICIADRGHALMCRAVINICVIIWLTYGLKKQYEDPVRKMSEKTNKQKGLRVSTPLDLTMEGDFFFI